MANCLGIYIDDNVIKYAKVSKERDDIKIDSYGIKFYDNAEETIKQIINETYSYKIPICTNITDEQYTYSDMFNLLNKKDLKKAIDTDFELFCNENGKNKVAIEYRTLQTANLENEDKITTIYAYTNKSSIMSKVQQFGSNNVSSIVPTALAIPYINNFGNNNNSIIVNIEDKTTITTLVGGKIYKVDVIENGMKKILDDIATRENSLQKAYEICKNATIYTLDLQETENEYMTYIMPTLYNIIEEVKEILAKNKIDISDIYISGLATAINNLDIYFQENFIDKKCEILTPYFIDTINVKLNIKDYIEVNSAIALALNYLSDSQNSIDFKKETIKDKISSKVPTTKEKKEKNSQSKGKSFIKMDLGTNFDIFEISMLRAAIGIRNFIPFIFGFFKNNI